VPRLKTSAIQRGSETFERRRAPMKTTSGNATRPIIGFGKPNTDACQVFITVPQERTGLKSQEIACEGSMSEAMRS
jgi:hypothetical protein